MATSVTSAKGRFAACWEVTERISLRSDRSAQSDNRIYRVGAESHCVAPFVALLVVKVCAVALVRNPPPRRSHSDKVNSKVPANCFYLYLLFQLRCLMQVL